MAEKRRSFEIPRACHDVIDEVYYRLVDEHRGANGEIDDCALTLAVMCAVEKEQPEMAKMIKLASFPFAVHERIRYRHRHDKTAFALLRDPVLVPARPKGKQRSTFRFRDETGRVVVKSVQFVKKSELPLIKDEYAKREAAQHDVVMWCDAMYQQMDLMGLGDDSMVSDVVACLDEDAA